MSRTISGTVNSLIADGQVQRTCYLFTFQVGENIFYFTSGGQIVHAGNTYLPHLIVDEPVRYSEKLRNQPTTVKLQNITLETSALLKAQVAAGMQGVEATLQRLYLAARETVTLFAGRVGEIVPTERDAAITLNGELDPTAAAIPRRKYSPLCSLDYKSAACGSTSSEPTCGKTFQHCVARGVMQNFDGIITITRDLTMSVEGQLPDAKTPERTLSEWLD